MFKNTLETWVSDTIKKNNTTTVTGIKEVDLKSEESRLESIKKDIDKIVTNGQTGRKKFFEQ